MPKRFNLTYINSKGEEEQPIVIHRSSIGALERVMAFLIEKHAGAFPLWLAPIQVAILPVSEKHEEYARKVNEELMSAGMRTELDLSNQTLGGKIRSHTLQKVPFQCIIGDKEAELSQKDGKLLVSVRERSGKDLGMLEVSAFLDKIKQQIEKRI